MSSNTEAIEQNYDRAIQQFQPGGFVTHGKRGSYKLLEQPPISFP